MERVTGFAVLEEMERLRASRIEGGLVPVWLPADHVEAWAGVGDVPTTYGPRAIPVGAPYVKVVSEACREALEGQS